VRINLIAVGSQYYCNDKFIEGDEMLTDELERKYDEFSMAVQHNDSVDPKTTTMLYLASSMAVGCYP
jgi:hypothetical protein